MRKERKVPNKKDRPIFAIFAWLLFGLFLLEIPNRFI